ncbi:MAG TPA: S24 family peptidase [Niabella sp.]|nr:S24 family peptidase [Niabella sp.]
MEQHFSNIKKRIIQHLENVGISKRKFYIKTGIANGVLDKATGLTEDNIEKYISKFPEINTDWLLTGNGDMYKPTENEPMEGIVKAPQGRLKRRTPNKSRIEFYDIDFAAGGDIEFYEDNGIKPAYTMDIPEFNGCTAFRSYSNSMEKLIHSGDILFGTREVDWHEGLEYGQIYGIVSLDGRKFLKYIRRSERAATHFLFKSENVDEYDDFDFPKERIKSIWLIHGWLKKRTG